MSYREEALAVLEKHGPSTTNEIADRFMPPVGCTEGLRALVRALDALVADGLVERTASPGRWVPVYQISSARV